RDLAVEQLPAEAAAERRAQADVLEPVALERRTRVDEVRGIEEEVVALERGEPARRGLLARHRLAPRLCAEDVAHVARARGELAVGLAAVAAAVARGPGPGEIEPRPVRERVSPLLGRRIDVDDAVGPHVGLVAREPEEARRRLALDHDLDRGVGLDRLDLA